jgi:hypothetical protein
LDSFLSGTCQPVCGRSSYHLPLQLPVSVISDLALRRLSIHLLALFPPVSILDQIIPVRPSLAATESMDETWQQATHDGSHSIPLTDLAGLGIDISPAIRTSEESDLDTTPHRKTTLDSTHLCISPLSTGGLSGSTQYGQCQQTSPPLTLKRTFRHRTQLPWPNNRCLRIRKPASYTNITAYRFTQPTETLQRITSARASRRRREVVEVGFR